MQYASFREKNNLQVDGIAGPQTFAALLNQGSGSSSPAQTGSNNNSSNSSNSTVLRNGSRGASVSSLQEELKKLGYYTMAVDGIYGSGTTRAVRDFQRANNLQVDGIAGPQTFGALNNGGNNSSNTGSNSGSNGNSGSNSSGSSSILRVGSSGNAVTDLQKKLRSAGFFSQNPTGYYGQDTATSVRNFQRANNLLVDGIAGPQTFAKLNEVSSNPPGSNSGSGNAGSTPPSGGSGQGAMITNLIAEASKHIGVPYLWGGTSTRGFDCSGFVQYVFNQQNISISRTVATQWNAGKSVSKPSVGDVVFFATTSSSPSHNGIYIGNNKFIHSGTSTGVTISDMNNSYWKPRYLGAKRVY